MDKIYQLYQLALKQRFPLADVVALSKYIPMTQQDTSDLHGALDHYWANIAGYASSISNLDQWPNDRLEECQKLLGKPFFLKYPEFDCIRKHVTCAVTPNFLLEYTLHEKMRRRILLLIGQAR